MARISILFLSLIFFACGPASKLRRAERLIRKAEQQGAVWRVDTVFQEVPVVVEEVKTDTIVRSLPGDTVTIEKERLKIKYVKLPGDSVFIEGRCEADTVIKIVPTTITKTIEAKRGTVPWWWLAVVAVVGLLIGLFKR